MVCAAVLSTIYSMRSLIMCKGCIGSVTIQMKMKALVFFVLFHIATGHFLPPDEELDNEWIHFKTRFGKSYRNEEEELRRTIWQHTLSGVALHNIEADLGMHSYRMGINQYSDMTKEYEKKLNILTFHPAEKIEIGFSLIEPKIEGLEIYTDGSGIDGRIGAAMVVYDYGQLIHSQQCRLPDHCTVFQAEVLGLEVALEFCCTLSVWQKIHIFSDSRSALQAIQDPNNNNEHTRKIKTIYKKATDIAWIRLHCIKVHVGYVGNEMADIQAKESTSRPEVDVENPKSEGTVKSTIRRELLYQWQGRCLLTKNGSHTRKLLPEVKFHTTLFHPKVVQFLTGHGRFPSYFVRFGKSQSNTCPCGKVGDPLHCILECDNTKDLREHLRKISERANLNLPKFEAVAQQGCGDVSVDQSGFGEEGLYQVGFGEEVLDQLGFRDGNHSKLDP
ncbi:hypothetical protein AVEN_107106-1 [Araneus ventricosus]|uniref:ribonuclease H n=1 Tax=Araneus ventricosus TaxID=182803 RepID=A0A4Y2G6A4_ARAVE|nr:hypothetical protein AVEN_107106-1 [Araneus ventricosus]